MRDLAWDGEWIWGSGDEVIYAFTPEGELAREFEGPYNPNNNFAWDTDREILWVSSTTSDIIGIDREGNEVAELDRHDMRIYGLAYWPDDPDGYPLYIFHKNRDVAEQIIHKMNPENNDTAFVAILEPEQGGSPMGAFITNQFDVYSWVFVALSNEASDDRIDIWQVDARRDWFGIEPVTGVVEAEQRRDFTLALNTMGLPQVRFEGDIVFYHNADDGQYVLPVTLDVLGGRREFTIDLLDGWNLVSMNIEPDNLDIIEIFSDLADAGVLAMVKDGRGRFYLPDAGFNNIPEWNVQNGYQVFVTEDAQLVAEGMVIPGDTPIQLEEGWNMKSYFPIRATDARVALAGIVDDLLIAKDSDGNFYLPEFDFSNMGEMQEGQGYQFKVRQPVELIYQIDGQLAAQHEYIGSPKRYAGIAKTESNMSALLVADEGFAGFEAGAFSPNGDLVGSGKFDSEGRCGLAVWGSGKDEQVPALISEGEPIEFRIWNGSEELIAEIETISGKTEWKADDIFAGKVTEISSAPVEFGIHESYPNPTNGPVRFSYGVESEGFVSLKVYDLSGREVAALVNGKMEAGSHQISWNTDKVSSGIYLVRLESGGMLNSMKVAVLK